MEFSNIEITNFLSYADQNFSFEGAGLSLIEGRNLDEGDSNGSGKSSLFDAISFCLFGQTVRGLKGDDVINRKFKKGCRVALTLTSFGDEYIVIRHRKHSEYGDRLSIHKKPSGLKCMSVVELGALAQTQQWILDTFQIDFDLFRCTVLFAQGETFNFVDAGNKAQKDILSKVMKVSYDSMLLNAKNKLKEVDTFIGTQERVLIGLQAKIVEDIEGMFKAKIESFEANRARDIEEVTKGMVNDKAKLFEFKVQAKPVAKITAMFKRVAFDVKIKENEREELAQALAEISGEMKFFKKEIESAQELDGDCPVCKRAVDTCLNGEWIQGSKDHLASWNLKWVAKKAEVDALDQEIADLKAKSFKLKDLEHKHKCLDVNIGTFEAKIEEAEEAIKELESLTNPYENDKKEFQVQQDELKEKIAELKKKMEQYQTLKPYYSFWVDAFGDSGIKSFVFDLVCSNLTNKANKYLNLLSGGAISISFDTQKKTKGGELREKFDCVVTSDGQQVDYAAYSGGEKRRISLACDMALSDIMSEYHGSKFNVVVMDEQDSYLDANGRKQYLNLLKALGREKRVFVVAHDTELKGYFDHVVTVEKKGGISRIVS